MHYAVGRVDRWPFCLPSAAAFSELACWFPQMLFSHPIKEWLPPSLPLVSCRTSFARLSIPIYCVSPRTLQRAGAAAASRARATDGGVASPVSVLTRGSLRGRHFDQISLNFNFLIVDRINSRRKNLVAGKRDPDLMCSRRNWHPSTRALKLPDMSHERPSKNTAALEGLTATLTVAVTLGSGPVRALSMAT